jgi:hypothetical protein
MKRVYLLLGVFLWCKIIQAQNLVLGQPNAGSFTLASKDMAPVIYVDNKEETLVKKAASFLQTDIEMITGKKPQLIHEAKHDASSSLIIVGSLNSPLIKKLVATKKINTAKWKAQWEHYCIQVVDKPLPGVLKALLITGSDRRGIAYGVFELSRQLGVSPWYWWADVPVKKRTGIHIDSKKIVTDGPKVKYRGIFINDEAPALSNWSREKFGGFNYRFYEKVFELILRLKGNYLWPAMWGSAFYDDDSLNIRSADAFGIVIGTSHHEPLMRAHDEWRRYGSGKWNYDSNATRLKEFWRGGMQRATNEKIVSIGMRGDGDEPMSRETATALLEKIVEDQRQIIREVTGKPASHTPQLWALYKEVQDYYDKGMRVPDDVTLLLCDDNWGNIRKLPKLTERPRKGGYGIYYHFDYVGGPRNYKWLNTNNLARVWEQMHLAWEYGARQIWIVNVGDIKPMELPSSFFLDYAWDPKKWNESNISSYYTKWAKQQFGEVYADDIGSIIGKYSQLSARRKPELLDDKTYSLVNYNEFGSVVSEWKNLLTAAEKVNSRLPAEYLDAYFQLVLHPVKALTNLHELYYAVAQNKRYASVRYAAANDHANEAEKLFKKDSLITQEYHGIANGKWNHMMSQTHIGYTYWQQPPVNKMPEVQYITDTVPTPVMYAGVIGRAGIPEGVKGNVFYQEEQYVSMEAEHWTAAVHSKSIQWKLIPGIGRTGSGITTFPVTATSTLTSNSPHVCYEFYSADSRSVKVNLYFSPTLNFHNDEGLKFAVSLNDGKPVVISLNKDDKTGVWNNWVANNIIIKTTEPGIARTGKNVLKYWMISPGVVLQKLVVDFGGTPPSYLGPPESRRK